MKAKTNAARSRTSGSSQKKHPIHDKKDQRQVEMDHESLANAEEVARIGSWKWDLHSKKVTWSDGMYRLFGLDRETFDGDVERIIADRIHPDDAAAVNESNRRVLEDGVPQPISYRILLPDGAERTVLAQGKLLYDENGQARFLTGYVQDITERVRAENKILQLQRMYATLSQVNQVIVRVKDRQELFQAICDIAVKYGEISPAWVGLVDEETGEVQTVAANGRDTQQGGHPILSIKQGPWHNALIAEALHSSQVVTRDDIQADVRTGNLTSQAFPFHSLAVIPFHLRGRTIGIVAMVSERRGLFKDQEEVRLLEEMAVDISHALDNIENEKERQQAEKALQESENRYRDLVETSNDAILINRRGRIAFINRRGLEMLGATEYDQIIGRSPNDFFHPDFHALGRERIKQVLVDQVLIPPVEQKIVTLDGKTIPVEVTTTRVVVNSVPSVQVILRDITERQQADEKLRQSEEKFRAVFENSPDIIFTVDRDTRIQFINRVPLGVSLEDALQSSCLDYVQPEHRNLVREKINLAFRTGQSQSFEVLARGNNDSIAWYSTRLTRIKVEEGVDQVLIITTDITERKRAEEALQLTNDRFQRMLNSNIIGVVIAQINGGVILANDYYLNLLGVSRQDFLDGRVDWRKYTPPEWLPQDEKAIQQLQERGVCDPYVKEYMRTDGTRVTVLITDATLGDPEEEQILALILDVTETKQAEEKLRQSEERYRVISENTADVIWVMDPLAGKFKYVSPSAEKLRGYTPAEIMAQPVSEAVMPESLELIRKLIAEDLPDFIARGSGSASFTTEISHPHKNGSIVHTENTVTCMFNQQGEVEIIGVSRDITGRRRAEQVLRENEERLRLSLQAANQGLYDLNVQTGDAVVNREYAEMLGYEYETFVETNAFWIERLHPDDREITAKAYADYVSGLRPDYRVEFRQRTKDGSWMWILSLGRVIEYDEEGKPLRMLGTHTDITERKHAEEELRTSEERYRSLIENMNDIVMEVDENGNYCYLSPNYANNFEYSPEEELGETALKHIHPDDLPLVIEKLGQAFYSERQSATYRVQRKNGDWRWLETVAKSYRASDDSLHLITVARDITERKQAEEALRRNEHVLRLFVEHSPASIAMFDRDMRYIVASRRYLADYRLPDQDLTGRSHYEVFPEIPEHWREVHRRCLAGAIEKMEEDPFPREDGTLDWVRWEIRPWYDEADRVGGIILFSEVITDRKQIQDDLRLLNVSLEQRVTERTMEISFANRAKDEFLANMSHELRTPLNAILGLSESLLEQRRGPLNERQIQSIELVASSGKHLLSLINDILEVSKIEAGKLDLHTDIISVKELCVSSLNFIRELALKKLIALDFVCEESISTLEADPQRLKQILINLLTNAVKFTPERGRVGLQVSMNAANDLILFSVIDTGIGIAQEDLKKLFIPFTQLDSSLARQYAGTGLGLSLVQKLTEAHGGSVEVESEVGKGSRFTVVLPLTRDPDKMAFGEGNTRPAGTRLESAIQPDTSTKHVTVLLAEDNRINSEMVRTYLELDGYTVLAAQNGEEVLQKLEETVPDIIVMDIQMPKMDGLETTHRLRQDPRFAAIPVIALTALVMAGDRERCLEAGANEYLSKPVSLKTLTSLIEKLT